MAASDRNAELKQALISTGQPWSREWQNVLDLDEDYFAAYVKLRKVPVAKQKLTRKIQELLLLAMDASCTHLFEPGMHLHTAAALEAGASKAEIMETLELTSVLGVHAVTAGVPLLMEVLEESGVQLDQQWRDDDESRARKEKLKNDFVAQRGYWSGSWPPVLDLSPDFFEAYTEYSSVPFGEGHRALEAKVKELVYCAIDCSTTHLYLPGLKIHIQNAIRLGATPGEIMEVFELAALMGAQTVVKGAGVLKEQLESKVSS